MSNELQRWIMLIEGRDAPLYHGTDAGAAISIIKADEILASTQHEIDAKPITGVSLSRDVRTALDIGQVCFELSQTKLAQNHRLLPIDFTPFNPTHTWTANNPRSNLPTKRAPKSHGDPFEYEEFCVGSIRPLHRYLVTIHVSRRNLSQIERKHSTDAEALVNHPLLKIS